MLPVEGGYVPQRVPTGIQGLDEMLGGGLLRNSVAVVKGAPGTGKSCLGIEYIWRGATEYDEPGMIISFEEFPRQFYRDAASIGCDLQELENRNALRTFFASPAVFLQSVQEPGGLLDQTVEQMGVKRVLVDSMSQLERIARDPVALREIMYAFLNGLQRYDLTVMVTQEDASIMGAMSVAEAGLPYIVDTIIQLRYVEINSQMNKAVLVLKHRASDHDKDIRQFEVTPQGIAIKAPFEGRENILSGEPRAVRTLQKAREFFQEPGKKEG